MLQVTGRAASNLNNHNLNHLQHNPARPSQERQAAALKIQKLRQAQQRQAQACLCRHTGSRLQSPSSSSQVLQFCFLQQTVAASTPHRISRYPQYRTAMHVTVSASFTRAML